MPDTNWGEKTNLTEYYLTLNVFERQSNAERL